MTDLSASSADEAIPAPEGRTQIIDTEYEIGQDNINYRRRFVFELDKGGEIDQIDAAARQWNAAVGEEGRLRLAVEPARSR